MKVALGSVSTSSLMPRAEAKDLYVDFFLWQEK